MGTSLRISFDYAGDRRPRLTWAKSAVVKDNTHFWHLFQKRNKKKERKKSDSASLGSLKAVQLVQHPIDVGHQVVQLCQVFQGSLTR